MYEEAIATDPLLARRLVPQPRPGGRWVVVFDDRSRVRLRELLKSRGWDVDLLLALQATGRTEMEVPPPVSC